MMVARKRYAIALIPLVILLFNCSPQFTPGKKDKDDSSDDGGNPVTEDGVNVTDDATGSSLSVPPGALAVGSNVTVGAADAPAEFAVSEDVVAASAALAVSGTDPSGAALGNAQSPMTLNIPLGGTGLHLTGVEQTVDNVCTFLKTNAGDLFVWRRSQLTIDNAASMITLQTYFFGIFQAVYCGNEPLPDFKDPTAVGIPDETKYTLTMTIPADVQYDQDKYCGFAVRASCGPDEDHDTCDDDNDAIIGASEVAANAGSAVDVSVEFGASVLMDKTVYFRVGFHSAGMPCSFVAGKSMNEIESWNHNQLFAFPISAAEVIAGVSGTLGEDEGFFKVKFDEIPLKIDVPAGHTFASQHADNNVCIDVEFGDGPIFQTMTTIDSSGYIGGSSELLLPVAVGAHATSNDKLRVRVTVGGGCFEDKSDDAVDTATGKPYHLNFSIADPGSNPTLVMVPISLSLSYLFDFEVFKTAENPLNTACIDVSDAGVMRQTPTADETISALYAVKATEQDYHVLIPYLAGANPYDMHMAFIKDDNCFNKEDEGRNVIDDITEPISGNTVAGSKTFIDQPLNPDIQVPKF